MQHVIRVVLAQGSCFFSEELTAQLERRKEIEVCAAASTFADAGELIVRHRPDVFIATISTKCSAGMIELRKLKRVFSGIKMLAYSSDLESENLCAGLALRAGANGYVSSADSSGKLLKAIRAVHKGKCYVSSHVKLRHKKTPPPAAVFGSFPPARPGRSEITGSDRAGMM